MNACEEISQNLKQNILLLQKSAVKSNIQESTPQKSLHKVDAFILDKWNHPKIFIPEEKCFTLSNPYFEFSLTSNGSSIESHLEKLHNVNNGLCKEEKKQAPPLSITKYWSEISAANLLNGIENGTNSYEESAKIGEKKYQEAIQLMKPIDENNAPKKRRYEDGVADSSILGESNTTKKKFLFITETEAWEETNPYLEYILKLEGSSLGFYFDGNSEGFHASNIASSSEEKIDEKDKKRFKNGVDIFGNRLTSKDRNKFKVICPHCTKKVPAPGFVRHLSYCMRVSIRRRKKKILE